MPDPDSILHHIPVGITSLSVGRASVHCLEIKIQAAVAAGFTGIEIFFEDLEGLAHEIGSDATKATNLQPAAHLVRRLCSLYGMEIINLQPFRDYDGLISTEHHEQKIAELRIWLVLCKILGTSMIVITSSFPSQPPLSTGDESKIVHDLREAADLGAREHPPVRFAYEAISWGAYVNTWQHAWKIVQKADRPNLGLCLDSFHVLAKTYASPKSLSGRRPAGVESFRQDLQELTRTVSPEQLFTVQLSDAARLDPPLSPQHPLYDPNQDPLMTWSRQARLFPLEKERGAYLPVLDVLRTCVIDIGYRGWISLEIFNESLFNSDPNVPSLHAQRGMTAWHKCRDALRCEIIHRGLKVRDVNIQDDTALCKPNHSTAGSIPSAGTLECPS